VVSGSAESGVVRVPTHSDDILIWDQHGCLPLRSDAEIDGLLTYLEAGVSFVSINAGFDAMIWHESLHVLSSFRQQILADPEHFLLANSLADVSEARKTGRLAVAFDLEGAESLDGDVAMVEVYYRLGVRSLGRGWLPRRS
jgi:membrane dipeptidase